METYLATLAAVNATILAIFGAAFAAYLVFLRQRATEFEDVVSKNKVEISAKLSVLKGSFDQSMAWYIAPDVYLTYKKIRGCSGAKMVFQCLIDLVFGDEALVRAVKEVSGSGSFRGPWEGRIYFWCLKELVNVLTLEDHGNSGSPKVFPATASGPGFDQWRSQFDKLRSAIVMISRYKNFYIEDFREFLKQTYQDESIDHLMSVATRSSDAFFAAVDQIVERLSDIDRQRIYIQKYDIDVNGDTKTIIVLLSLTGALGICLPLLLLAATVKVTALLAVSMLLGSVTFHVATFWQFGANMFGKQPEKYAEKRWLDPMILRTTEDAKKIESGGVVDSVLFGDALASNEIDELREDIIEYIDSVDNYVEIAVEMDAFIVDVLKQFSDGLSLDGKGGATGLVPLLVVDEGYRSELVKRISEKEMDVSIETPMPWWSHCYGRMSWKSIAGKGLGKLEGKLSALVVGLEEDGRAQAFRQAKQRALDAGKRLMGSIRRQWTESNR